MQLEKIGSDILGWPPVASVLVNDSLTAFAPGLPVAGGRDAEREEGADGRRRLDEAASCVHAFPRHCFLARVCPQPPDGVTYAQGSVTFRDT